jgi:lipopolysaccharide/colanic/teichoic acid biosynthesis glycosyltransferase
VIAEPARRENEAILPPWLLARTVRTNGVWIRHYLTTKRLLDLCLVLSTSPFWLFVLLCCAVCSKLEDWRAPVFFRQLRTGRGGKRFMMLKLRTMVPDAEAAKERLRHLSKRRWPDFKIENDPRITRVGRFLRKSSLDELPQLINVLRGEMSLVGPRPTSFEASSYSLWQTQRLEVPPGITGLWQIVGRGSTEFGERLRLDIAYIERRSLGLDLEILVRTIPAVLAHRGGE